MVEELTQTKELFTSANQVSFFWHDVCHKQCRGLCSISHCLLIIRYIDISGTYILRRRLYKNLVESFAIQILLVILRYPYIIDKFFFMYLKSLRGFILLFDDDLKIVIKPEMY